MRIGALFFILYVQTAAAMPPSNFMLEMSRQSELLKQSQELRKKANAEFSQVDNLWASTLGAQVGYLDTQVEGLSQYSQTGIESEATWSQITPIGLSAAFTATFFEDDDRDSSESFSVAFEQKLWQNSFGSADRSAVKAAELSYKADLIEADLKLYEACAQSYDIYFNTWRAAERLRVLKEVSKLADQSFNITRRNFKRRLIRRLDFESAHVDFLAIQDRVLAAENEWIRESENYKRYSKLPEDWLYAFNPVPLDEPSGLLSADLARLRFEALDKLKDKEKSESRTDVALFADASFSDVASTSLTGNTETESYLVGVKLDFPWLNNVPSSEYKAAMADALRSEQVWRKLEGDERVKVDYLKKLLKELEQKLVRHEERLRLRVSQSKQARKYLNSGKLEFDDYLRYRNGELDEKLRGLDLIKSYWDTRLGIMQSTGDGAKKLCRDFVNA